MNKVNIDYFSDVLCIWAFSGQVRLEQLRKDFGEQVSLNYRFIPIFGASKHKILANWKDKGGFEGLNRSLHDTANAWDHITLHPKIWLDNVPATSTNAHLYLKSVQILEDKEIIPTQLQAAFNGRSVFEELSWRVRCAFFELAENIADIKVLDHVAGQLNIPVEAVHDLINSGEAHAALQLDDEARQQHQLPGSPTLVFNDGRQQLYGNVGYRIIEANIRELLHNKLSGEASWC